MEYANLDEEFEETYEEMKNVPLKMWDVVLVDDDGTGKIRIGKIIETGSFLNFREPPQYYFGVEFDDRTEKTFMDDDGFIIKRKAA
jgi:hypothetical protein